MNTLRTILPAIKLSGLYFLFLIGLPTLLFIFILSYYFLVPYKDPQMFPLDDAKENYVLTKDYDYYSIRYSGKKRHIVPNAYVLYSPVELSSFVNKNVEITGEFIADDIQCIKDFCTKLSARYVGIKIVSIN